MEEGKGRADVLISNAGTDPGPWTVKDIDEATWWSHMVSNFYPGDYRYSRWGCLQCSLMTGDQHPRALPLLPAFPALASTFERIFHLRLYLRLVHRLPSNHHKHQLRLRRRPRSPLWLLDQRRFQARRNATLLVHRRRISRRQCDCVQSRNCSDEHC